MSFDYSKATDQQLMVIIIDDPTATLTEIADAAEEYRRRYPDRQWVRVQQKIKAVYH